MKKQSWASRIGLIVTYLILVLMVVVTLFPILWIIGASFNRGRVSFPAP